MKKTLLIVVILVAAVAIFAMGHDNQGMNCRQGNGQRMGNMEKGHQGNHGDMMMRMMNKLELTDKQEAQMKSQQVKIQKSAINIDAQIKTLGIDAAVAKEEMNFSDMKSISNSIFDLKKELKNLRIDNQEKCWNLLTTEQKEQAMELRKQGKGMRKGMRDGDENQKTGQGKQRGERMRMNQDDND